MNTRLFAAVDTSRIVRPTIHFRGMPSEIAGERGKREELPYPSVLVIKETSSGVFLIRYAADGSDVGDTWHLNIADAQHQAQVEYDEAVGEWKPVPLEITDLIEFVRAIDRLCRRASQ